MVDLSKLPLQEILFAGRPWQTGRAVRFAYREERLWPETKLDPAGEWLVLAEPGEENDGWLRFRRPLVLEWGSWRGHTSWKWKLWKLFHQRKGPEITSLLQRLRYDGIITTRWGRPYQILNLTGQEVPWEFDPPGLQEKKDQCLRAHGEEFTNLARRYPDADDLMTAAELSFIFEQHLTQAKLLTPHQSLWEAWDGSTASDSIQRLQGFMAYHGVPGRPAKGDPLNMRNNFQRASLPLRELVEHQYAFVQTLFEVARIKRIKVYRGLRNLRIKARRLHLLTREVSSWTLSFPEANYNSLALGALVPRSRVLLVPGMRVPFLANSEVVILGSSQLQNVRWEHPECKQTGSQEISIDAKNEDWLRLVQREQAIHE